MILYDLTAAQGWGTTKQHGGGKYAEIVFKALCEKNASMVAMWDSSRWISEDILELCKKAHVEMVDLSNMSVDNIVRVKSISLIYSALPQDNLINYKGCDIISTLHGLRGIEQPFDWLFLRYPGSMLGKMKLIIKSLLPEKIAKGGPIKSYHRFFENDRMRVVTVSNHTKYAIETYYPDVCVEKLKVFYSPSTSHPNDAVSDRDKDKYMLVVSAAREEKNALRAIMAFDKLQTNGKIRDCRMKLTGIGNNIFNYKIKNPDKFDFLGYVSEDELNVLFANAYALVYPSMTEGFGYPPLEAMRYGVPVLASSLTSISEVCGGSALYFNPFSLEEIMNRMLQINDDKIYKEYSEMTRPQYEKITSRQVSDLERLIDFILASLKKA